MNQYKKYKKYKRKYKQIAGSRPDLKRQQSAPPKLGHPYHNYRPNKLVNDQLDYEGWVIPDKEENEENYPSDEEYYHDFDTQGPVDPHMQPDQLTRSGYLLPSKEQNIEDYSGRLTNPYVTKLAKENVDKQPPRRTKSYGDISNTELERSF
jgi:hypothetical protein